MRTPWLLLAFTGIAAGQFAGFSTSADGSVLHFSTMLRQSGTQQLNYGKIFRVTPEKGVELVLEHRDYVLTPPIPGSATSTSNYYRYGGTVTSANGTLTGYGEFRDCRGGSFGVCAGRRERTTLDGKVVQGSLAALSSGGEYAVTLYIRGAAYTLDIYWHGQLVRSTQLSNLGAIEVGDEGSLAYQDSPGTIIFTASGRFIVEPGTPAFAFLGGSIYLLDDKGDLEAIDLTSGARRRVRGGLEVCPMRIGLSGTVYQWCNGLQRTSLRGGISEVVTRDQAIDFVVSRNERIVWYLSAAGAIKSFDLLTSETRTYVGPTPMFNQPVAKPLSPGGLFGITATALAAEERAAPPLPHQLGSVRVRVNGRTVPIEQVGPRGLVFQAPYDVAGTVSIRVDVAGTSEFTPDIETISANVLPHFPLTVTNPASGEAVVAHGDWSGLVTRASPARPGELIHFYLTGLAGVPGAPALGDAAARDRAITFDGTVQCALLQEGKAETPATVFFVGLAPGTAGYSQLSVRVPDGAASGFAHFYCVFRVPAWAGTASLRFPIE